MIKRILIILTSIMAVILVASYLLYRKYYQGGMVPRDLPASAYIVHIPTNASYQMVEDLLVEQGLIKDPSVFRPLAEYMEYTGNPMRSGRFEVQPGWTTIDLIRHLRGGKQAPVNLILTNERLLENVAAKAARFIEPDSLDILTLFRDQAYLDKIGYTEASLMSLFIPNTYEFFWNTSPEGFVERMLIEHDRFWKKNNREAKAEKLGMTKNEVYTLASIVEKETLRNDEKKRMAGVYLNRLRIGMPLQADPTAIFATRDFGATRVTDYHTEYDSPYNTYQYKGLPPGPISMASISSIDAVLEAETHKYLYFCAIGDGSGYHAFARTLAQHNQNAARYRANLRQRGLR